MIALSDDSRPRRASSMAWQTVAGETILFQVEAGQLMGVNPVAAYVWSLLDGTHSVRELAGALVARFAVDEATALADLRAFLDQLLAAAAIELPSGAP
jgi:hypothetical protein